MLHGRIWKQTRICKAGFYPFITVNIFGQNLLVKSLVNFFPQNIFGQKLCKDHDRAIAEVIIATNKLDFLVAKTKATAKRIFSDCLNFRIFLYITV